SSDVCSSDLVAGSNALAERERAGARVKAISGGDVVLEQDGDPVERTAGPGRGALAIEGLCDLERLGIHLEHRVEVGPAAIVGLDALEKVARQPHRGQ